MINKVMYTVVNFYENWSWHPDDWSSIWSLPLLIPMLVVSKQARCGSLTGICATMHSRSTTGLGRFNTNINTRPVQNCECICGTGLLARKAYINNCFRFLLRPIPVQNVNACGEGDTKLRLGVCRPSTNICRPPTSNYLGSSWDPYLPCAECDCICGRGPLHCPWELPATKKIPTIVFRFC